MANYNASYGALLGLACFALAAATAGATRLEVGGANGWSVPPAGGESFNSWAGKNRFQIGDTLEFVYPKDSDSVLLVEPAAYNACNTSSYVKRFADGDTVFPLDKSGPLFFISGVEANCRAGEKLIVMVLGAGRNNGTAPSPSSPSSPPPAASSPPPSSPPPATSSPPPSSPPPATSSPPPSSPAPAAPATTAPPPAPVSAPPPASPPTTTPTAPPPASSSSPPAAAPPASTPPSAPADAPRPPPSAASPPAHSARAAPPPAGSSDRNGAGAPAGLAGSLGACVVAGYAMLAL